MHAILPIGLLCLVALSACEGSGTVNGRHDGDLTVVSGRILDAVNGTSLQGVEVRLSRLASGDDSLAVSELSMLSDADGRFTFDDVARDADYAAAFDAGGYKNEVYSDIELNGTGASTLQPVRLVSDDNAGTGQLAGHVNGDVDASQLSNLTLDFREGINRRTGDVLTTVQTDSDGAYRVDGLGYGNVTAEIRGESIRTGYATFQVLGNILSTEADIAVEPAATNGEPVEPGSLRIVLTWNERPRDLDAHLTGPDSDGQTYFHVFSGDRESGPARLVDDATLGTGPETIEIDAPGSGLFRYSVFNFSGDTDRPLEQSGARVEVFADDESLAMFSVPEGVGNQWTVFDIDDGHIQDVNTIAPLQNILDYFPPQVRELASVAAVASSAISAGAGGHR